MRRFFFNTRFCLLFICIFTAYRNWTFAEITPMPTATPQPTPTLPRQTATGDATDITSSSATLNATVLFGMTANYIYFEYGTTTGVYTNSINASHVDKSDRVTAKLTNLSPLTTYYYRIVTVTKPVPPVSTGYTYGVEKSFTTLAVCEVVSVTVFPKKMTLERESRGTITVTLAGKEECSPVSKMVVATVNKAGSKRISVTPTNQEANEKGKAKFTITTKNIPGNAKVTFEVDSLEKSLTVKVRE